MALPVRRYTSTDRASVPTDQASSLSTYAASRRRNATMRRHLITPKIPANQATVHHIPFPCWRHWRPDGGGRSREGHPVMICHGGYKDSHSGPALLSCSETDHVDARPLLASQPHLPSLRFPARTL